MHNVSNWIQISKSKVLRTKSHKVEAASHAIGRCESDKKKEEIEGFLLVVTTMLYDAENAGKLQKNI